jgi:hypothetical protein
MATLTEQAINESAPSAEVAKAAVKDAVAGAQSDAEKEALGLALYKEATGRFPQDSSDRRAVYTGGFVLVGLIFVVTAALTLILVLGNRSVPEWISTLATALASGVIGGLFGYAKQG